jgi:hypothetical protein
MATAIISAVNNNREEVIELLFLNGLAVPSTISEIELAQAVTELLRVSQTFQNQFIQFLAQPTIVEGMVAMDGYSNAGGLMDYDDEDYDDDDDDESNFVDEDDDDDESNFVDEDDEDESNFVDEDEDDDESNFMDGYDDEIDAYNDAMSGYSNAVGSFYDSFNVAPSPFSSTTTKNTTTSTTPKTTTPKTTTPKAPKVAGAGFTFDKAINIFGQSLNAFLQLDTNKTNRALASASVVNAQSGGGIQQQQQQEQQQNTQGSKKSSSSMYVILGILGILVVGGGVIYAFKSKKV